MELPLKPYERKKSNSGIFLNVIIVILVLIIIFQFYFSLNYTRVYVIGESMYPTLIGANKAGESGGDYVLIYDGNPEYGDIVVVEGYDESSGEYKTLIKRVIALGGDIVYLDHGELYIKYKGCDEFVRVEESYLDTECNSSMDPDNTYPKLNGGVDTNGHLVADGCMFLLGDYRNVSKDSRYYGDFSLDGLVGIVSGWSISCKSILTAWFTFWDYTLPSVFS